MGVNRLLALIKNSIINKNKTKKDFIKSLKILEEL